MKNKDLFKYSNTWIFIFIIVFSLFDIFLIKSNVDFIQLILGLSWVYMLKVSSAAKIFTLPIILFFILFIPICLVFKQEIPAQKLSIWVFYIFSVIIISKSLIIKNSDEKK